MSQYTQMQKVWLSCLFATVVFAFNAIIPSYLNGFTSDGALNWNLANIWSNPVSEEVLSARSSYIEFARRPLVVKTQELLAVVGIPAQGSFLLINFFCFILFHFLLTERAGCRSKNDYWIIGGIIGFTFSNIFAFAATICTYDDFLQYALLLLFLRYYDKRRLYVGIVFLFFAVVAREVSLFFLIPIVILEFFKFRQCISKLLIWTLPLLGYSLFLILFLKGEQVAETSNYLRHDRFVYLVKNIEDIRETGMAVFLTAGIPTLLLLVKYWKGKLEHDKPFFWAALSLIIFNTTIAFVASYAREARYYFLPLLFFIPLIKKELAASVYTIIKIVKERQFLVIFGSLALSLFISFGWYSPHVHGTGILFKVYSLLYSFAFFVLVMDIYTSVDRSAKLVGERNLLESDKSD